MTSHTSDTDQLIDAIHSIDSDEPVFDRAHKLTADEACGMQSIDLDLTMDILTDGGELRRQQPESEEELEANAFIEESRIRGEMSDDHLMYTDEKQSADEQIEFA